MNVTQYWPTNPFLSCSFLRCIEWKELHGEEPKYVIP